MASRYLSGWKRLALGAAATCISGCHAIGRPALGTFASTGGILGTFQTEATMCSSGVSKSAFGTNTVVWFAHRIGRSWDFELSTGAISGKLTMVMVQRPSPFRQVELEPSRCARFEVQQRTGADGSLGADVELDCDAGDGGRVVASIHAASCR